MKVSVKAVYHIDGVYIRMIINRRTKSKKLFTIGREYFREGSVINSHPNALRLNHFITKELTEWRDKALDIQTGRTLLNQSLETASNKKDKLLSNSIIDYAKRKLSEGQYKSYRKYKNIADKVIDYRYVSLSNTDSKYWSGFHTYLKKHKTVQSAYTINRYFQFLKTVVKYEKNDGYEVDTSILNMKIHKGSVTRAKLSIPEFQTILDTTYNNHLSFCKDIFAFMVYTWGSRIGDVLQLTPQNIVNGRIEFTEQKTNKFKSIGITPEIQSIIDRYTNKSPYYLFPMLQHAPSNPKKDIDYQKHIEAKTTIMNKALKSIASIAGIKIKLTNHIARHSFALWASHKDIPIHQIQQMLNHGSKTMTENYIKDLTKSDRLDDAANSIFS